VGSEITTEALKVEAQDDTRGPIDKTQRALEILKHNKSNSYNKGLSMAQLC